MNLKLKCQCGSVTGELKNLSKKNIRTVCMCDDCQTFAHYLGKADIILDAHGGSEIIPSFPAQIVFHEGKKFIKCMSLSPNGLHRWFTECCHTPIANTSSAKMPYAGISRLFIDLSEKEREEMLGQVFVRIFGAFGKKPLPRRSSEKVSARLILWTIPFIIEGKLLEKYEGPFYDHETKKTTVTPIVISKEERQELRKRIIESGT